MIITQNSFIIFSFILICVYDNYLICVYDNYLICVYDNYLRLLITSSVTVIGISPVVVIVIAEFGMMDDDSIPTVSVHGGGGTNKYTLLCLNVEC